MLNTKTKRLLSQFFPFFSSKALKPDAFIFLTTPWPLNIRKGNKKKKRSFYHFKRQTRNKDVLVFPISAAELFSFWPPGGQTSKPAHGRLSLWPYLLPHKSLQRLQSSSPRPSSQANILAKIRIPWPELDLTSIPPSSETIRIAEADRETIIVIIDNIIIVKGCFCSCFFQLLERSAKVAIAHLESTRATESFHSWPRELTFSLRARGHSRKKDGWRSLCVGLSVYEIRRQLPALEFNFKFQITLISDAQIASEPRTSGKVKTFLTRTLLNSEFNLFKGVTESMNLLEFRDFFQVKERTCILPVSQNFKSTL